MIPHGEAWLLETLAIWQVPICCLSYNELQMHRWLLRGSHRLSPHDLEETLERLFVRHDIEAHRHIDPDDSNAEVALTWDEFRDALNSSDCSLYCGVTAQGGVRWESLAKPDWSRYFDGEISHQSSCSITAGSHSRLLELLENSRFLWHYEIDLPTISITRVVPWSPFPWKQLSEGVLANFSYEETPYTYQSPEQIRAEFQRTRDRYIELRSWATSICGLLWV